MVSGHALRLLDGDLPFPGLLGHSLVSSVFWLRCIEHLSYATGSRRRGRIAFRIGIIGILAFFLGWRTAHRPILTLGISTRGILILLFLDQVVNALRAHRAEPVVDENAFGERQTGVKQNR